MTTQEVFLMPLQILLCVMMVMPIITGFIFSIIEKYWKCQLDYRLKLAMAQAEVMKKMVDRGLEKPGEDR